MIRQIIFDMQPLSSVREEEDRENLSDSSRSNVSSRSSTSNSSRASEDYGEEDVLDAEFRQTLMASREGSVSESSSSHGSSAGETKEDEMVNAIVAAWLPKLRGGRALVRQEALAANRELGIDITTVSMTAAEAALARTNMEMGTAVTMEDVEAMGPIDLDHQEPDELAPGDFEEDELEEMMMGFIHRVKKENE